MRDFSNFETMSASEMQQIEGGTYTVSACTAAPKPVYVAPVAPKPVYVAPKPVYVAPKPVYVAPKPVYVAPKPVYVAPKPSANHGKSCKW
jgi:bacteriocin-like protein